MSRKYPNWPYVPLLKIELQNLQKLDFCERSELRLQLKIYRN